MSSFQPPRGLIWIWIYVLSRSQHESERKLRLDWTSCEWTRRETITVTFKYLWFSPNLQTRSDKTSTIIQQFVLCVVLNRLNESSWWMLPPPPQPCSLCWNHFSSSICLVSLPAFFSFSAPLHFLTLLLLLCFPLTPSSFCLSTFFSTPPSQRPVSFRIQV